MTNTIRIFALGILLVPALFADGHIPGMETKTFSVVLSPSTEVPPIVGAQEMGTASIQFNIHRDMTGMVNMVIVDFRVNYTLGSPQTIQAMHIHKAAAGMNGGVVVNSNFGEAASAPAGSGAFFRHTIVSDPMGIETLMDIMAHPDMYYLNIHTAANPGGHLRGQLYPGAEGMVADTNKQVKDNSMKLDSLDSLIRSLAASQGISLPKRMAK